ncbi:hypothetical protein NKG05_15080 [Oerskovia sp. M15]
MIILLAMHREACGEIDEARRLLQELMGRRDRQFLGAVRRLRDLEYSDRNYAESLRLAELVLREDPEADWLDRMDLGSATAFAVDLEAGWALIDDAVELCARTDTDRYARALGQRALRFLASGTRRSASSWRRSWRSKRIRASRASRRHWRSRTCTTTVPRKRPSSCGACSGKTHGRDRAGRHGRGQGIPRLPRTRCQHDGRPPQRWHGRDGMAHPAGQALRDRHRPGARRAGHRDAGRPRPIAASTSRPGGGPGERGEDKVLAWHDGQLPGTGALWGDGQPFRLMTGAEIHEMDDAIEQHPESWPGWDGEGEYYTQIFTDDAGAYLIEGTGGRLYRRGTGTADQQAAASLADWIWDRVVAFGGRTLVQVEQRRGRRGTRNAATMTRHPKVRERAVRCRAVRCRAVWQQISSARLSTTSAVPGSTGRAGSRWR